MFFHIFSYEMFKMENWNGTMQKGSWETCNLCQMGLTQIDVKLIDVPKPPKDIRGMWTRINLNSESISWYIIVR